MASAAVSPANGDIMAAADPTSALNEATKRKYIKDRKLGEGTYAVVFLGLTAAQPTQKVAIKKIKVSAAAEGLSMDAIREVKFLSELRHENVIRLLDVFGSKNQNLNLVLEYLDGDLEMLIKDTDTSYGVADMKSWIGMALRGVEWCHRNFVLHRVSARLERKAQTGLIELTESDRILSPTTYCLPPMDNSNLQILVSLVPSPILNVQ